MADAWERVSHRYCWLWGGKTQYNWWCWVFKMLLFVLVSTLVPIAEDGKLIMWIHKRLHTYLYKPRNISILNHSFFVRIHFGTEWNTRRNIFVSHFHFLSLSFLYRLVSYLFTPIVLLSFYFFLKWELFVMVIIRVYQSCSSETDIDFICSPHICIFYTFHYPILFVKDCWVEEG